MRYSQRYENGAWNLKIFCFGLNLVISMVE